MKHLKLFEEFSFSDMEFLIDQLSNSMEFYDEEEFVNHISNETNFSVEQLKTIYDAYWVLEPDKRGDIMFDWEEWIDEMITETP